MSDIKFSKEEKQFLVNKIQAYFEQEMNREIGQFEAEFLLDFFSREVGAYYYNQGLSDARSLLAEKLETISDAFYEIEKPTEF